MSTWLMRGAIFFLPRLYMTYMRLVEVTSRHDDESLTTLILGLADRHDRVIAILWHQEVFSVAYNYRHLRGHTLASVSDFGDVIAGMLRRCNFVVIRGGSASGSRKRRVLPTLIEHMRTNRRVLYGLTVDGSRGPVHELKLGGPLIARACQAPIICVRTRYRYGITLPTWDRTQIPLPFNRRLTLASGPYWIAPDASEAALETFRAHLENELLELTERVYDRLGTSVGKRRWAFPQNWQPAWPPGRLGSPQGPHDLDWDHPPGWAHRPPESSAAPSPSPAAAAAVTAPPGTS